jgi:hypothetical protein
MTRDEIEAAKVSLTPQDQSTRSYARRNAALGWFYNAHTCELSRGWSDGMSHSRHNITGDSGSQNMGCMYRTKGDAARALRHEISRDYAKRLAAVDRIIAKSDSDTRPKDGDAKQGSTCE